MKYKRKVLKNGLRVITVPMKDNPTVTVLVLVEVGSKYESKKINGVSHFLEHMCFKGTVKRPKAIQIVTELDSVGAQYNAFTSQEWTGYYAKANSKHSDLLIDVVSDIYLNPLIPKEEVEKERGVIIEEINMYNDMPNLKVQELITKLLYGDQPAGWDVAGTKETVGATTRDDIFNYRHNAYVAGKTTVVVAGSFNEKKILSQIEKSFKNCSTEKGLTKLAVAEAQNEPQILKEDRKIDQTHLVLGVRTFDAYNKQNAVLRVLSGVLGGGMSSRLFEKMRNELGICYYVRNTTDALSDHGFFSISAGVKNERLIEALSGIMGELELLKNELVSKKELDKVKEYLVAGMYLHLESSDSVADFYGSDEILNKKLKKPEEVAKEIYKVTAKEINDLAKKIFVNKNLNLAIVGPQSDDTKIKEVLKFK